jgi:hypothetical protein
VNDGKVDSAAIVFTVTASALNIAPEAKPGANQSVALNPITKQALVTLDGSTSFDANGDTLTYSWSLVSVPDKSNATLTGANTAKPTFTADQPGSYVAALIVNDKKLDSKVVTTTVTAAVGNVAPMIRSLPTQSVFIDKIKNPAAFTVVTLDGSDSFDDNGDKLTYSWVLFGKPVASSAVLDDVSSPKPKFNADIVGTYAASLIVCDPAKLCSETKTTYVVAAVANVAPVADAGAYQNVVTNTEVTLDASGSRDDNGDPLKYTWALVSQPASLITKVVLSSETAINPKFTPPASGTYVFSLKVSDGSLDSDFKYVTITAGAANVAPDAKVAQNVIAAKKGDRVTLDGSLSTDANGDTLLFTWVLINKPAGSNAGLVKVTDSRPYFDADLPGYYVATLVVSDGRLDSKLITVVVNVSP